MEKNEDKIIKKEAKEWHSQHHHILKEWAEIGYSYRYLHDRAFMYYSSQNFKFALPVIIISTLTGTANFAQKSFPLGWQGFMPLVIGSFNLIAGLITTIAQFLRVSELLEGNRSASIGYDKFARNISVELSLPIRERELSGSEFISKCRLELDKLIEQSPNIPQHIIQQFSKKFEQKAFFKPNILDINPIEIYIDDEHEQDKAMKLVEKETKLRNKILKQEEDMRNKILENIRKEEKENKIKIKEEFEKRKIKKKKQLSTRSVTKNIDKLLKDLNNVGNITSAITPDTSDLDSNDENSPLSKNKINNNDNNNNNNNNNKNKNENINNNILDNSIIQKPKEILNNISILINDSIEEKNNIEKVKNNINKKNNDTKSKIPKLTSNTNTGNIIKFEK